jgi:uncharacterized repeat protein (TIGR01451 family)
MTRRGLLLANAISLGTSFVPQALAQQVEFSSPAGGEIWLLNSVHTIAWTVAAPSSEPVKLCLVKDDLESVGVEEIAVVPLASGTYDYTVSSLLGLLSNRFYLAAPGQACEPRGAGLGQSGSFRVASSDYSRLDVRFAALQQSVVRWGETVPFELTIFNDGTLANPAVSVTVALPAGLVPLGWQCTAPPGSRCSPSGVGTVADVFDLQAGARVTYAFEAVVSDTAPADLEPVVATVRASVALDPWLAGPQVATTWTSVTVSDARVVSPNGGEISTPGASRTVHWRTTRAIGDVELSLLRGSAVTPLATVPASEGSHTFTVPSAPGSARVALRWYGLSDESDDDFYIVAPAPPAKPLDLDGDGKADILWRHQQTGELYAWFLDGRAVMDGSYLTPPAFTDTSWQIRAIADMDGDGQIDILWHHRQTGDLYVWLMNGTVVADGSYLTPKSFADTRWQIRGVADFSGDGKPDVLWHNRATGELYVWFLDAMSVTGGSHLTPGTVADPQWQIRGVSDLDRDGKADLLWHNQATGDLYVWYLLGTAPKRAAYLTPPSFADVRWQIRRVDDFDGDGQPDVLWHHQETGELYVWLLDGSVASRGGYLVPDRFADTRWQIVPR